MLIDLNGLVNKYQLKIDGVIHIGAHYGQEITFYEQQQVENVVFFEPLIKNFKILETNVKNKPNVILKNMALGNMTGFIEMFVESSNQGMSSSILEPKIHLQQYPHITFNEKEVVQIDKLDNIDLKFEQYNMINIDVQGYELEVFKGAENTLKNNIDIIYSEVNRDEVYKGCPKIEELDTYLKQFGFLRLETDWAGGTWGDALYLKLK